MPRRFTQYGRDGSTKVCEINKNHIELPRSEEYVTGNDPCPVCEEELYYDDDYTRRIGLLDNSDKLEGWMCPYCNATFDNFNNLSYISTTNTMQGKA